jgi:HAD superfamily hydrolase (TIGR01549 family)
MKFKAIFFDWDGTLLDSVPAAFKIYQIIMRKYKNATLSFALYRDTFKADYHKYYEMNGISRDKWEEVDSYWLKLFEEMEEDIPLFLGVKEFLSGLHGDGFKVGLISNGSGGRIRRELKEHNIEGFFDVVISEDEVYDFKPSPEGIHQALKILKLSPKECVYVGDMIEDIEAGKKAGVKTIAVLSGVHSPEKLEKEKPDYIFKSVLDIKKIIEKS